jgi:hypothetical protein
MQRMRTRFFQLASPAKVPAAALPISMTPPHTIAALIQLRMR